MLFFPSSNSHNYALKAAVFFKINFLLPILFCFALVINSNAATCTASAGNWGTATIWSCGHTPQNGDLVIIPEGVTVNVDAMYGTFTGMTIEIYGTLNFIGGRKITLAADGILIIHSSGLVTGGNGGSQFEIGGTDVYVGGSGGGATGPLTGPTSCNSAGCVSVVPIKLISFTAEDREEGIQLKWITETETNNSFYTIQRSIDGVNFENIAEVQGAGNSIYTIAYSYLDKTQLLGTLYYRLKQTDFNGDFELFDIISVFNKTDRSVQSIYPNPNNGEAFFSFHNKTLSPVKLSICEVSGKLVYEKNFDFRNEFINEKLNLTGIGKGLYFIYIYEGNKVLNQKIVLF